MHEIHDDTPDMDVRSNGTHEHLNFSSAVEQSNGSHQLTRIMTGETNNSS
jgi:hypothetical protein